MDISRINTVVHTGISIYSERELLFEGLGELKVFVQMLFSNQNKDCILRSQIRMGILQKY